MRKLMRRLLLGRRWWGMGIFRFFGYLERGIWGLDGSYQCARYICIFMVVDVLHGWNTGYFGVAMFPPSERDLPGK